MHSYNHKMFDLYRSKINTYIEQMKYVFEIYKKRGNIFRAAIFLFYFNYEKLQEKISNLNKLVKVNGYRLKIIPEDLGISRELALFKIHEPLTTKILKKEIKKNWVCFDIGSNIGYYAILESKLVGNSGQVFCFEPSPTNFSFLKENISLNNVNNIKLINAAIGDVNSKSKFVIHNSSNLSRIIEEDKNEEGNVILVPTLKLDSFMAESKIKLADFIRMDLEGYEHNVYLGMRNTIKKFKPDLSIEIHPLIMGKEKTIDLLKYLKNDGYEIKHFIFRVWDFRFLANKRKDIISISIDKLIELIKQVSVDFYSSYNCFQLYLTNKTKPMLYS